MYFVISTCTMTFYADGLNLFYVRAAVDGEHAMRAITVD